MFISEVTDNTYTMFYNNETLNTMHTACNIHVVSMSLI